MGPGRIERSQGSMAKVKQKDMDQEIASKRKECMINNNLKLRKYIAT